MTFWDCLEMVHISFLLILEMVLSLLLRRREGQVQWEKAIKNRNSSKHSSKVHSFISFQAVISIEDAQYNVGGWDFSEIPRAYLNRTAVAENLRPDPGSFQFVGYTQRKITAR